jgi:hypothetical protein
MRQAKRNNDTMDNTPRLTPNEPNATPRQLLQTALLAAALLLIPLLLGTLLVLTVHKIKPVSAPPPKADTDNSRMDADATNLLQLVERRRDRRNNGDDTEDLNVRIWAAHADQPTPLFRIDPPGPAMRWNWHLSQDGLFALAVSVQTDAADRRSVGLFDLVADRWLWKKSLPWPDSYEAPYVFNRHVVLRYAKNAKLFAMEIDERGAVTGIDVLRRAAFKKDAPLYPVPGFPGTPVALRHGVLFTSEAESPALAGYALERLPGLHFAGKGDGNTLFSGNGRLKFSVQNGRVTVADSLTQTVLQRIDAWPHSTNTLVTGARVTHDGSQLSLFLKTTFGGTPAATREWSVSVATYTGTITPTFNPDALLAKPQRLCQRQTDSSDRRWHVSVTESNLLSVVALPQNRPVAHLDLGNALSLRQPIDHIAFLEEDRHLVIRQRDNFWLLDFGTVLNHADLLARKAASAEAAAQAALSASAPTAPLAASTNAPAEPFSAVPGLALRAEWYALHGAWGYAAAALEAAAAESDADGRAPRVNPLLQAHAYLLSGQKQKARLVCREALARLISDSSDYNRMVRYHLQGLLFSQP